MGSAVATEASVSFMTRVQMGALCCFKLPSASDQAPRPASSTRGQTMHQAHASWQGPYSGSVRLENAKDVSSALWASSSLGMAGAVAFQALAPFTTKVSGG